MKGLLLKDWYLLCRQMRLILLLMVVFACLPGLSISAFAVFYAAMLPISMLASDERSHWEDLASMMPCTTGALVGSKYLLGVLLVLAVSVLSTAAQLVTSLVKATPVSSAALLSTLIIACLVLLLMSIELPLMFHFGVEKGRLIYILFTCVFIVSFFSCADQFIAFLDRTSLPVIMAAAVLLAAAGLGISYPVSVHIYQRHRR